MNTLDQLGLQHISYKVFSIYPDLALACTRTIEFLGDKFPGAKEPLLYEMLKNAFREYELAEKTGMDVRKQFILGLCTLGHFLYKVRYCSSLQNDASIWTPMEMKITSFEISNPNAIIINERDPQYIDEHSATRLFAARVLPGYLFAEIFSCECANEPY